MSKCQIYDFHLSDNDVHEHPVDLHCQWDQNNKDS